MADGVALGEHALGQRRMGDGVAAEHEEGRAHAFVLERGQHPVGGAGPGPVVEGQHHLLRRERQRHRELLAADRRRLRRIDGEHAFGAERRRIAGTVGGRGQGWRQRQQRKAKRQRSAGVRIIGSQPRACT